MWSSLEPRWSFDPTGVTSRAGRFSLRAVTCIRHDRVVLDRIDLVFPPGVVTAIVGPSGSGKTSLLRLLNRLDDPTDGQIELDDQPLAALPVRTLRQRVGFVFQTPVMFPGTVAENIQVAASLAGQTVDRDIDVLLERAGLHPAYSERVAADLSGGEQQRVSLARTLATRPSVLLLDEPTSALDPETADRLMVTIRELSVRDGMTTIMVTHRLAEARAVSAFVVMLESGWLVEFGPSDVLFSSAASPRVREYLGSVVGE